MLQQFLPALRMMIFLTVLTGLIYPGVVTGLCQLIFARAATGSLITNNGHVVGSALIGQRFSRPEYFHGRPSAAGMKGYDAAASGGSDLEPTSPKLFERVRADAMWFRADNPAYKGPIPSDAITASGSGLDPEISVANAMVQTSRVATARGLDEATIISLIRRATRGRSLALLGEPRVNVLELNLKLDELRR